MEPLLNKAKADEKIIIFTENKEVEGDLKVLNVIPLTYNKPKLAFAIFLTIMSASLLLFLYIIQQLFLQSFRWSIKLKIWFLYKPSSIYQSCILLINDNHRRQSLVPIKKSLLNKDDLYFTYCFLNYIFDVNKHLFQPVYHRLIEAPASQILEQKPLIQNEVIQLHQIYGNCLIEIPLPSVFDFLFEELTSPFYFVQYLSIALWVSEGFIQLATITFIFSVFSSLVNYSILLKATIALRDKAKQTIKIRVKRANLIQIIDSVDLVPGDIIQLENNLKMPCDCILLENEVLVDEQTLTGESVPVQKVPVKEQVNKKNIIFDGTKIVFVRSAEAIVIRTGFSSYKGQIFRNALFPHPATIRFYRDAVKFLIFYAILVFTIYFGFLNKMIQLNYSFKLIFFRFGDALTWVMTPSLIIFVNVCMTFTLIRLRMKNIYGTMPNKNMESGDVNMICFDKTGTLTTDQIDVKIIQLIESNSFQTNDIQAQNVKENEKLQHLIYTVMGACHNCYENNGEIIGDVLDLSLIKFSERIICYNQTTSKFIVNSKDAKKYEIIRILDFESHLQMMSVIAIEQESKRVFLFSKGAPEKIHKICLNSPPDFNENLTKLALQGFRVLALGFKELNQSEVLADRFDLERNLTLLGLVALENKLKDDTIKLIKQLRDAKIELKIVSGDSPLTTIHCGKECSILPFAGSVLLIDCKEKLYLQNIQGMKVSELDLDDSYQESKLEMQKNSQQELVGDFLNNNNIEKKQENIDQNIIYSIINGGRYEVAITGPALQLMEEQFSMAILLLILKKTKIFARMHPEQKASVIYRLQSQGFCVAMIGDGANDCSAIKMANIGISFANTDASNTSAFSSNLNSVSCVKEIILEGKATQTNVLDAFKYFMIINLTKFVTVEILMLNVQTFSNNQFLYMNYLSNIPLLTFFAMTYPSKKLTHHIVETSMMHYKNFGPLLLIIFLFIGGILYVYLLLIQQDWYIKIVSSNQIQTYSLSGQSNTLIFTIYIAIYSGVPFKPNISRLPHLIIPSFLFFILITFVTFFDIPWLSGFLDLVELQTNFTLKVYLITNIFGAIMIFIGVISWHYSYK